METFLRDDVLYHLVIFHWKVSINKMRWDGGWMEESQSILANLVTPLEKKKIESLWLHTNLINVDQISHIRRIQSVCSNVTC